jgi:hypothetical protein
VDDIVASRLVEGYVPAVAPYVFEQHKSRDDIAIAGGRASDDPPALLQSPRDAAERLVSEVFGPRAIPPIEVQNEPPANLEVRLAIRLTAIVEPLEQSTECEFRK